MSDNLILDCGDDGLILLIPDPDDDSEIVFGDERRAWLDLAHAAYLAALELRRFGAACTEKAKELCYPESGAELDVNPLTNELDSGEA